MARTRWLALLGIVILVGLPLRLYLAGSAAMLSRDGVTYVWYAQKLAAHPLDEIRNQRHHPVYPAMLLAAHRVIEGAQAAVPGLSKIAALSDPVLSWQTAGIAVTLVWGLAAIVAVYLLAAILFDWRVALVAAAIAAVLSEFAQLSADALTDMPHLTVYLLAAVCCIHGLRKQRLAWLLGGGALSGLAYLIRPEGVEVALVAVFLVAMSRWPIRRRLAGVAVITLGALAIASPYMMVTGKLIQKKSILQLLGLPGSSVDPMEPGAEPAAFITMGTGQYEEAGLAAGGGRPELVAKAAVLVLEKWGRALRWTFIAPAVFWLILWQRGFKLRKWMPRVTWPEATIERTGVRMVLALEALHFAIVVSLVMRFDYWILLSVRHALVLAALTLPFAAAGCVAFVSMVPAKRRVPAAVLLVGLLIGPTLPWLFEQRFGYGQYLRMTGEWLRNQPGSRRIMTTRHPVAFYANGEHVWSPLGADAAAVLAEARWQRPDYLVLDERRLLKERPTFFADLQGGVQPGERLELVHQEEQVVGRVTERARVYRYHPAR